MKKSFVWIIIWSIIAIILLVAGGALCFTAVFVKGYDFGEPEEVKFVTNTYELTEKFSNLYVKADTGDVLLLPSEDGTCRVVCYEEEKEIHDVRVENDTLRIEASREDGFRIRFGFTTEVPKITVYLPEMEVGEIFAETDTGDVTLKNVIATGDVKIETDTGDVLLEECDAANFYVETDTGDVTGTLLSGKTFKAKSDTGKVRLPASEGDGRCEIETDTGDVRMEIH